MCAWKNADRTIAHTQAHRQIKRHTENESNRLNVKTNQVFMHALPSCIKPIELNMRDGEWQRHKKSEIETIQKQRVNYSNEWNEMNFTEQNKKEREEERESEKTTWICMFNICSTWNVSHFCSVFNIHWQSFFQKCVEFEFFRLSSNTQTHTNFCIH